MIDWKAIHILWKREMKKLFRSKTQLISSLLFPLFFLITLGLGFRRVKLYGVPETVDYLSYLLPGIIGMSMMMASLMSGISTLWDKKFGFLKEIMVAPVSRLSIILGRMLGSISKSLVNSLSMLIIGFLLGLRIASFNSLLLSLITLFLIGVNFVGLGLLLTTFADDVEGFSQMMSLLIVPFTFLSGAFYPVSNLPRVIQFFAYLNPLLYGIDALRGFLINFSIINPYVNLLVLLTTGSVFIIIGTNRFQNKESV